MNQKKINRFVFLSAVVAGMTLVGCSSDDNNDPKEPDNIDQGYSQEEIADCLPGAWVTVDENGNWNRVDFTRNENENWSYVWLSSEGATPENGLLVTQGTWHFYDATRPGTSVILTPSFGSQQPATLLAYPTSVKEMEITWEQTDDLSEVAGSRTSYTFNRIITSVFATPGTEVELPLKELLKDKAYNIAESPNTSIATIDKSNAKVTVTGCGTTYIAVGTEEGTGYIEVTGSPLTKMPIDFGEFLGVGGREYEYEDGYHIAWDRDITPLKTEYPGISEITYDAAFVSNTVRSLDDIRVYPEQGTSLYAMWLIANQEAEFNSATKKLIGFKNSLKHFLLYLNSDTYLETPFFQYEYLQYDIN